MKIFIKKMLRENFVFEIPFLVESKLMNFFDYIILVAAPKKSA